MVRPGRSVRSKAISYAENPQLSAHFKAMQAAARLFICDPNTTKLPRGANRASQLYSLMDIYLLGMCWALYKRRARDMEVWGWEPLQMVLGGYMNSIHAL